MRASAEQLHVLTLAREGRDCTWAPLVNGKGSQSRTVGRGNTVSTCMRNGWLVWAYLEGGSRGTHILTDAGRAVLAAEAARAQAKRDRSMRAYARSAAHWEKGYRCHGLWSNNPVIDPEEPRNTREAPRLGLVSIGPGGLWDGKTYAWLIDNPDAPGGAPLAEGEAPSLREAKAAVELGAGRLLWGLPCTM
ncbi:hypothetical protein KABACHOK_01680 [Brevundimonas phage vB_BpoS-Kabachok]|uniref:Uncharacterized protein n=1 Tax=Brevundimonas phage vB_BpoS-Kabachok TaxID=2948600 RepID=A0A9E7SK03_9CAUD|nr:hypothetical protein KABACHOK_01680 [Brevundimonas phage vB_BpoS-Kabachok]